MIKKILEITACSRCNWFKYIEKENGYYPYCTYATNLKSLNSPWNTIPEWCPLPNVDAEEIENM